MFSSKLVRLCLMVAVVVIAFAVWMMLGRNLSFHQRAKWLASEYFDNKHVVELCVAIERNNISEIRRLVGSGVDVNYRGKDNMTPLLWALPDDKLERFQALIELGGDPNVRVNSDFGVPELCSAGDTVLLICAKYGSVRHFQLAMEEGGDPHALDIYGSNILHLVIRSWRRDRVSMIRTAVACGVDVDAVDAEGLTPFMKAVGYGNSNEELDALLDCGADVLKSFPVRGVPINGLQFVMDFKMDRDKDIPAVVELNKKLFGKLSARGYDVEAASKEVMVIRKQRRKLHDKRLLEEKEDRDRSRQ